MRFLQSLVTRSGRWFVMVTPPRAQLDDLLHRLHPVVPPQGLRRLGPRADGGYLVPDDLEGITACFSPGVGELSGFELDCLRLGMRAHLADASVDAPPVDDQLLDFIPRFIRAIPDHESITLAQWVESHEPDPADDLLLQIDIEGDEWAVFLDAPMTLLRRFRIIVCEFHRLDGLLDSNSFPLLATAFAKILESHTCVHIHPNNTLGLQRSLDIALPPIAEFTFLRNDRLDLAVAHHATEFPHPLDVENSDWHDVLPLPPALYRSQ